MSSPNDRPADRLEPPLLDSPGTPDRWLVLLLVAATYFMLYLHRSVLNSVQPPLIADLKLTDEQVGLLGTWFFFPYALAQLGMGYLGDRFRRRTVLYASLLGSVIALALMGLVRTFPELLAARVLMAIAQSASVPAIASTIADSFTPRTRSTAVGIYLGSYNLALVIGGKYGGKIADFTWTIPSATGGLDQHVAGWRMAMFIFAIAGALVALALFLWLREPPRSERLAEGGLGAAGAPLSRTILTILRVPTFWAIGGTFLLTAIVILAIQFWSQRYLHDRFGLNLEEAGLQATIWIQGGTICGLFCGGRLGDLSARRWVSGRTAVQLAGLFVAAPALRAFASADSVAMLHVPMLIYGFGIGLYQANLWTTTFEVIDPAARSTAIGLLNVAAGFGSWSNALMGGYQGFLGGLGNTLAALSLLIGASLLLVIVNMKFLLPHDYNGPLRGHPPRSV